MRRARGWKWMTGIAAVAAALAVIGYTNRTSLAMWGFDTFFAGQLEKKLEQSYEPLENHPAPPPAAPSARKTEREKMTEPFTLLLLGVDARKGDRGRSDTMMLSVVRPDDGAILAVSIPRDTYVDIPGRRQGDKITHAYAYGKAELAVRTVEQFLQVKVDHYAAINFRGFRDVIDAMGGIELPIEKDLVNNDPGHEKFVVKAGQPLYNGVDALNFVRYREDAGGDTSRMERHRIFLNAMLDKASEVGQWRSIPRLIDTMGDNFRTDMPPDAIIANARRMLQADNRLIYGHTLKGEGRRLASTGLWYYMADEADLASTKRMIDAWLDGTVEQRTLPLPENTGGAGEQAASATRS